MTRDTIFQRPLASLAAGLLACAVLAAPGWAQEHDTPELPELDWSFSGPFGVFDPARLQRGFKVYRESCATCHGLNLVSFRNLAQEGGPGFSEGQVRSLASEAEVVPGPDESGEATTRPGRPSDRIPDPFPNDEAARAANNGALPPDLSLMAKARVGGPDYIYALLTGFEDPPEDFELAEGMNYNVYFPGHQIAMADPLSDGMIAYDDDTAETVDNYARDVAAFLMWTAEPKLEERHRVGFRIMIYLAVLGGFLYLAKRRIWSRLEH